MKTLKLIDKYLSLLEQDIQQPEQADPVDATDVETQPVEPEVAPLSSEAEKGLAMLLVQAFTHNPTEQEINIVDAMKQELGQTNPKAVIDSIRKLLPTTSSGDEEMMDSIPE